MADYILSGESPMDIPYSRFEERDIPVLFYKFEVDGVEYEDVMERSKEKYEEFYSFIDCGKIPNTSQINQFTYEEYFRGLLSQGKDLLHICFGTGMTGSYNNAVRAAEELKEEFPDRKIHVVDSYCSSQGFGWLVLMLADLRDEGKSIDEVYQWAIDHAHKIHHYFTTDDLKYFWRTGRLSGPAATLGSLLGIVPLMELDYDGCMQAYGKIRGKKKAIAKLIERAMDYIDNGADYDGKMFIGNARNMKDAEMLKSMLHEAFPKADLEICEIGTIIVSHCGPGVISFYFMGKDRPVHEVVNHNTRGQAE